MKNIIELREKLRLSMLHFYSVHKREFDDDVLYQINVGRGLEISSFKASVSYKLYEAAGNILDILDDNILP